MGVGQRSTFCTTSSRCAPHPTHTTTTTAAHTHTSMHTAASPMPSGSLPPQNKMNGIDVDKFDYFMRDAKQLGATISFDPERLMMNTRVMLYEGKHRLCFHEKEAWNIYELFHTRSAAASKVVKANPAAHEQATRWQSSPPCRLCGQIHAAQACVPTSRGQLHGGDAMPVLDPGERPHPDRRQRRSAAHALRCRGECESCQASHWHC